MSLRELTAWTRKLGAWKGFTLAEILIALSLIAILAAVLLPTVAGQIMKGDVGRVMQDLEGVRAGVDQFLADVHRYPGKYSDLSNKIAANDAKYTDINGTQYPTGLAGKWSGPYVTKDTISAVVPTGFGGDVQNAFTKVANTNGINYLTIVIANIAEADFYKIDLQVDGITASQALARTTGLLRFTSPNVQYLATPIQ